MKLPALVTVIALACGTAMAADNKAGSAGASLGHGESSAAATTEHTTSSGQPREGIVNKMKRGLHRMGDATRNTMHRMGNAGRKAGDHTDQAARNDTRSMGAAGSDTVDSARRSRMDQAYEDSKSKQK